MFFLVHPKHVFFVWKKKPQGQHTHTHTTKHHLVVLLMVQKSGEKTTWDGAKTLQIMGFQLPFPQLVSCVSRISFVAIGPENHVEKSWTKAQELRRNHFLELGLWFSQHLRQTMRGHGTCLGVSCVKFMVPRFFFSSFLKHSWWLGWFSLKDFWEIGFLKRKKINGFLRHFLQKTSYWEFWMSWGLNWGSLMCDCRITHKLQKDTVRSSKNHHTGHVTTRLYRNNGATPGSRDELFYFCFCWTAVLSIV